VALPTSSHNNNSSTFTVFKNGSATTLIATWDKINKKGKSVTTSFVDVVEGDVISVQVNTNVSAATGSIIRPTVSFELEVDDDFPSAWDYDPVSKIISYTDGEVEVDGIIRTGTGFQFPNGDVQTIAFLGGGASSEISESGGKVGIGIDPTDRDPQEKLTLTPDSNFTIEMLTPTGVNASPSLSGGGLAASDYYFRVTASDGVGWTKASPQLRFDLLDKTYGIRVSLNTVIGATKYMLYRGLTSNGTYKCIEVTTPFYDYIDDSVFTTIAVPPEQTTAFANKVSGNGSSWLLGGNIGIGTTIPRDALDVGGRTNYGSAVDIGVGFGRMRSQSTMVPANTLTAVYSSGNGELIGTLYLFIGHGGNSIMFEYRLITNSNGADGNSSKLALIDLLGRGGPPSLEYIGLSNLGPHGAITVNGVLRYAATVQAVFVGLGNKT